ncbi:MAG: hypothetical protein KKC51_14150 [Verrucomicrobia bacterium]|nr:hypothetical protein [Verrucomicrobiota bacterium]
MRNVPWKLYALGFLIWLLGSVARAATPVPMSSQPGLTYTEDFGDIASWADDFSSGIGANRFAGLDPYGSGPIPTATNITIDSTNWVSGTAGGRQRGSGTLVLLATGTSDNTTSVAVDFYMDFTGVSAGTLSFDWAAVSNSTGDRRSSLRLYGSTDGSAFTELTGAQVLNIQNNTSTNGSVSGVALPSAFDGHPGARLRFYVHNGTGGTTGSRPKISLDNLTVTAAGGASTNAFTVMAANLASQNAACTTEYHSAAGRIFQGLKPDIVAIQEWNVTNANRRAFVDLYFGTGYSFYVESSVYCPMPNGIISRWPITASGEWNDTNMYNRDFAWATIDLPGTQVLHIVSVHIKAGDDSADENQREAEARQLTNYIHAAGWPSSEFIIIAGDLNASDRGDRGLTVLTNIVSDSRQPADQNTNKTTNVIRTRPYDYVLPNPLLDSYHAAVVVDGVTFSNGMVFDSRLWAVPPSPILSGDSAATDVQHLCVMKKFLLPDACTDCDADGMPDAWEIQHFGNTAMASTNTDYDNDRFWDLYEYYAGTVPTNAGSALAMDDVRGLGTNKYLIRWDSVDGKAYRVLRGTNLLNSFTSVRTNIAATAPVNVYTDTAPSSATRVFYRIRGPVRAAMFRVAFAPGLT